MHDHAIRLRALGLLENGLTLAQISRELGVARSTVREWARHPTPRRSTCFVCASDVCPYPTEYCYLLGQYLGDGYLVTSVRVPRLRITCAAAYPAIAAEVDTALQIVSGNLVSAVIAQGCTDRGAYWMHWPCLFPQHGPGRKHERVIDLADWQRALIEANPWPLIRGLIHSDGCRALNRVTSNGRSYAYPRYFFANESRDILAIMGWALDLVGAEWRYNRPNSISVARRASVALLDERIGPKR